ncbi:hypothetical protein KAR91_56780, partial [Candidatus Pacearchaeota archaeon]|nr:hypothetical protein [Candidatus Pacearchaeota archaeon]
MIRKLKIAIKGIETELETLRRFGSKNLPNTFQAFLKIGDAINKAIQRVAADKGVKRISGNYLERWSKSTSYPHEGDPFRLHMENDLPYAVALEEGRPGIDMLAHYLR